jgi:hypothetical protein
MFSDDTSDMLFDLSKDDNNVQIGRIWDSKPTTSTKLLSNYASKNTAVSLVDMTLLEESPPLSLFFLALAFFGFASTSCCGLASTGFSSGLASTGFFGFVLSGVLQKSFASY